MSCTRIRAAVVCILFGAFPFPSSSEVTIFAAASLATALSELLPGDHEPTVTLSFASTAALARQIDNGAPADLFVSANRQWMDYLQQRGVIDSSTRVELLSNRLVIIAPSGSNFVVETDPEFDFSSAFVGRLAIGDPEYVPAGIYAKQALTNLGWWTQMAERLAPAPDVRAATVFVARGECAAGVVYTTDALVHDGVEVVATLPEMLHGPIHYCAAITADAGADAWDVMRRLMSPAATEIFRRNGFTVLSPVGS